MWSKWPDHEQLQTLACINMRIDAQHNSVGWKKAAKRLNSRQADE